MAQNLLPQFSDYNAPNVGPILQLHRGRDGFVQFSRRAEDGNWEEMGTIKADELNGMFPQLAPELDRDTYFSVNGYWRPSPYKSTRDYGGLTLSPPNSDIKDLRWLNACFADLDVGRENSEIPTKRMTVADAVAGIIQLEDEGVIPPPSMIARSGQGVWVFWLLRDSDKEHLPVRAYPDKLRLWVNIQAKLSALLAALAADVGSRDAIRVTRVPGSINTKVGRRSNYWIPLGADGKGHSYTLREMADLLQVCLPQAHPAVDAKKKALSARGIKGQQGRWKHARSNFELLWETRRTFKEGTRNFAVFIYASILRSQRLEEDVVWYECQRLYESLERGPGTKPFTVKDFNKVMSASKGFSFRGRGATQYTLKGSGFGGIKNRTIADLLDVTPEESAMLHNWPPASRFAQPPTAAEAGELGRREAQDRRQGLLKRKHDDLDAQGIKLPSIRDLAAWLETMGLPCSPQTVAQDLKTLGIVNPRSESAKRKKRAATRQRKFID